MLFLSAYQVLQNNTFPHSQNNVLKVSIVRIKLIVMILEYILFNSGFQFSEKLELCISVDQKNIKSK